jgi:hypothetical protein
MPTHPVTLPDPDPCLKRAGQLLRLIDQPCDMAAPQQCSIIDEAVEYLLKARRSLQVGRIHEHFFMAPLTICECGIALSQLTDQEHLLIISRAESERSASGHPSRRMPG